MNRVAEGTERSAGGVIWRRGRDGALEVCLISTRGGTRWQLPKGHIGARETERDAARREVREETGCDGEVEDDLGEIAFGFYVGLGATRRRVQKTVRFFLVRYQSGETRDHDGEVDDAVWISADLAIGRLTFDSERDILRRALALLHDRGV